MTSEIVSLVWATLVASWKPGVRGVIEISAAASAVLAALTAFLGKESVERGITRVVTHIKQLAESINVVSRTVREHLLVSAVATETSPASPWWEDGPVHLLFLWIAVNFVPWYETSHPVASGWAVFAIELPILLSMATALLLSLSWFLNVLRAASILVSGIWRAPADGYWTWCKPKLRQIDEMDEVLFNAPLPDTPPPVIPSFPIRVLIYAVIAIAFALLWPEITYGLFVGACLWIVAAWLRFFAGILRLSVRAGQAPRMMGAISAVLFVLDYLTR